MVRERRLHVYLDSSVVLRKLFRQPGAILIWDHWDTACSSELLQVEVLRTIDREIAKGTLEDQEVAKHRAAFLNWIEGIDIIQLRGPLLARASGSFPIPLTTLDALHLATALAWKEQNDLPLALWTHDHQLALAARAMGLEVEGA